MLFYAKSLWFLIRLVRIYTQVFFILSIISIDMEIGNL